MFKGYLPMRRHNPSHCVQLIAFVYCNKPQRLKYLTDAQFPEVIRTNGYHRAVYRENGSHKSKRSVKT